MTALLRYRRHRLALPSLLLLGLIVVGTLYAAVLPQARAGAQGPNDFTADQVALGRQLFVANCATCHGLNAEGGDPTSGQKVSGPSLIGVGAASVDFQVGTGRMPLQNSGPQAPKRDPQYTEEETRALAAYVASLAPGPGIPAEEWLDPSRGSISAGGELFRVNCAMCHNFAGNGGALTQGKYAPQIQVGPVHIYEAMLTGPQNMPVFGDEYVTPEEKRDIIAYLDHVRSTEAAGGLSLGGIGPVSEGLVAWVVGIGGLIGAAIWLGARSS